ncbi:MAG: hypothetical protein JWL73_3850, partial [Actinomycetia bacterium]|nr:hypothetical protein [Actinomycetes bacterium]
FRAGTPPRRAAGGTRPARPASAARPTRARSGPGHLIPEFASIHPVGFAIAVALLLIVIVTFLSGGA